jgi:hypothetical protein
MEERNVNSVGVKKDLAKAETRGHVCMAYSTKTKGKHRPIFRKTKGLVICPARRGFVRDMSMEIHLD